MTDNLRSRLTQAIAAVTDTWDEPLDDVHDIPPIVNAVIAELAELISEERTRSVQEALGKLARDRSYGFSDWQSKAIIDRARDGAASITTDRRLDLYYQLDYLEQVASSNPSERLLRTVREEERRLAGELRELGVEDVAQFMSKMRNEIAARSDGSRP